MTAHSVILWLVLCSSHSGALAKRVGAELVDVYLAPLTQQGPTT